MTYANVMVFLGLDQKNEARLEAAAQLAEHFDAALTGIAASQFNPPMYFTAGEHAQALIDDGQAALRNRLAELEAQFRTAARGRGRRIEWRCAIDFPARYILQQSRCADIIVGAAETRVLSDPLAHASPGDLVMQAGRPLLMVPDGIDWLDLRHVLVAWKDTPEARRAVADSLPILRKAKGVTVAEIPEHAGNRKAAVARVRDVVAWLSNHGIEARELVPEGDDDRSAAAHLDALAADVDAGIIVAGAYGHSRYREMIFGGVTHHRISRSARCVLLSH